MSLAASDNSLDDLKLERATRTCIVRLKTIEINTKTASVHHTVE